MSLLKYLILISFCFLTIEPMAIQGPALTRYDPCGLGVIHFDRLTEKVWRGVLHLGLYRNLLEVEIEIEFEKQVKIYGASMNATLSVSDDWHKYMIKTNGQPPNQYVFYLAVEGKGGNDSDVPTVKKFSLNNVALCDDDIKASQTMESLNLSKETDRFQTHICGRRSLGNTELVSMRTEAKEGDWPWHVAIFIREVDGNETSYYCGGNIISKTAIVTAGHCVVIDGYKIPPHRIVTIAGTSNHKAAAQPGRQILVAQQVMVHPSYMASLSTADLAIIKVNRFTYTAYVQPICIWGPVYDKTDLVGRIATVVGFGHDEDNNPSDVLRSAYILVQNDSTCIDYSPGVYEKLMNEFTFCAGYGPTSGTNPRNGDSGGGLTLPIMQTDHRISWFLRGVLSKCGVSPGHTECDPTFYVVYTDVGPHYSWIFHHSGLSYRSNIV